MTALPWAARVELWDRGLAAVRAYLRAEGMREVSTPVRVAAPAIEPFIEPIAAPPGYLATSPELAMKRLLCRGAPSIFQISHVFREAEIGAQHSEEFHLVEWYRVDAGEGAFAAVIDDVERLVAAVWSALGRAPPRWERHDLLDVLAETTGLRLRGDEARAPLVRAVVDAGLDPSRTLPRTVAAPPADPSVATLLAWTELFTSWSDDALATWLSGRAAGVHLVGFPAALAALSECTAHHGRAIALRFESHVMGVELANGYQELRDAAEQRRRFERVNLLRAAHDQAPLPIDAGFLEDLAGPGLPPCAGVALGLDRLLMLATGVASLGDIALAIADASP
ncbi:MAG: hypothetical protein KC636_26010 [Myxococcales bacterium]|nr:hypothetical protein [Myxococcales bacterium]